MAKPILPVRSHQCCRARVDMARPRPRTGCWPGCLGNSLDFGREERFDADPAHGADLKSSTTRDTLAGRSGQARFASAYLTFLQWDAPPGLPPIGPSRPPIGPAIAPN